MRLVLKDLKIAFGRLIREQKMRLWLLAALAALLWSHGTLLEGAEAKKARKRPKEMTPQHTEVLNTTLSNSEEEDEITKVNGSCLIPLPLPILFSHLFLCVCLCCEYRFTLNEKLLFLTENYNQKNVAFQHIFHRSLKDIIISLHIDKCGLFVDYSIICGLPVFISVFPPVMLKECL